MALATPIIGQPPINLGPLTTTFTPPPECTTAMFNGGPAPGPGGARGQRPFAFLGQTCSGGRPADATSCWPPTSSGAVAKDGPLQGWGYYSPGVHCPVGYEAACTAIGRATSSAGWGMQFKLRAEETAVGCCPSGYMCTNIGGQTCLSLVPSATSLAIATSCDGSDFAMTTVASLPGELTLLAPMIQINWQSSDKKDEQTTATRTDDAAPTIPTLTPAVPTQDSETNAPKNDNPTPTVDTGSSQTDTVENSPQPPSNDPASNDPNSPPTQEGQEGTTPDQQTQSQNQEEQNSPQLSSSTKIGIGVAGGAVAAVAIILIVFYLWRRRNSRHEDAELDRLYGMKHANTGSTSDLTAHHAHLNGANDEIPGWYRGARPFSPLTPTVRVESPPVGLGGSGSLNRGYQGIAGGGGGSINGNSVRGPGRGLMPPSSPYYRPYRPNMS